MKKIIKGKVYDTSTAREVGSVDNGNTDTDEYVRETLYRKRTGEYFLHGSGGSRSRYARINGDDWMRGEYIIPMRFETAKGWAKKHMTNYDYMSEFDVSEASDETVSVCYNVKKNTRDLVESECRKTGETRSAVVDRIVSDYFSR